MARRDALSVGIRLLTKNGHDWASRYPLILQAVRRLKVRSCLIDGEAVVCDGHGLAMFSRLRTRRGEADVFLFAFDLSGRRLQLLGCTLCAASTISRPSS